MKRIKKKINSPIKCGDITAFFVFPLTCAAEKHIISEKPLIQRFFKGTGVVLAEHNNRLPPVADKRRVLWRRGQRKFALQANIFCVFRKSRERSQKSLIFASGIPVQSVAKIATPVIGLLLRRSARIRRKLPAFRLLQAFLQARGLLSHQQTTQV